VVVAKLRYYPNICLEELIKPLTGEQCSCQDLNRASPKYISYILLLQQPAQSIITIKWKSEHRFHGHHTIICSILEDLLENNISGPYRYINWLLSQTFEGTTGVTDGNKLEVID
jgi:hypothetical protein